MHPCIHSVSGRGRVKDSSNNYTFSSCSGSLVFVRTSRSGRPLRRVKTPRPFSGKTGPNGRWCKTHKYCLNLVAMIIPAGSPSRGGDAAVYIFDIKQPSLPTPLYSVLVSVSVFMAFSTLFHSINSPDNSLTLFFWFYFCLIGPFDCVSLC